MLAFNFEVQALGRMLASMDMISNLISKPVEQKPTENIFGTYSKETPVGVEHFFRSTDADDNGAGWDNRLGK
ncbi:MAG: hypothetical protein KBC44_01285 [Candidatus Pacebacteria bacterium]|nr:hypothetical protein [Candidatus Paceibacterota bacterium]MBP9839595.1 hypothetical protein [Candidatus Paceibacterota bacterium]